MYVNDKFHHTIQFHPALSLQKVTLPSPIFLFSTMAGEMSGKFKNALEKSKSGFQRMAISQWVFNFMPMKFDTLMQDMLV